MAKVAAMILVLVFAVSARAQTLFVSDVDDTIKLANVQDMSEAVRYALDGKSRFMGMSDLYNLIAREQGDVHVVYLSKAPEWLMKSTHQFFLVFGGFPAGDYIGRTEESSETHKLVQLRALMEKYKPRQVIFIGDNGEQDPDVYAKIVSEYANQGIEFHQFIRVVYSDFRLADFVVQYATPLHEGQTGFVTPVEIAFELEKRNLLSSKAVDELIGTVVPRILKFRSFGSEGELAFPYYVNCRDFVWKWDGQLSRNKVMPLLKTRIVDRCGLKN